MPFLFIKITKTLNNILTYLKQAYVLDLRALGLMRIGISIVLFGDLIIRSLSIIAFFTDEGVLPIELLKSYNWNPYYFSFHALSGELWWQVVLFCVNAACIISLMIGFKTRFFTFICWAFLVSLQNRNPFILQGGDDLLRLTLLWCMFLPWGQRYSIIKQSSFSNSYFSIANIGFVILICSVYFFSALLKTSPEWHNEGTAIYYALSLEQIRMPLGTLLYQFPLIMKLLTWLVYYIELIAPLLILIPVFIPKLRIIGIVSIALLHIGIGSTLYVGLFFIIGLITLLGILPSNTMNWIEQKWVKDNTIIINDNKNFTSVFGDVRYIFKTVFLGLVIGFCLMLNLSNIKAFPFTIDAKLISFGNALRLEQSWGMFSPFILKDDGFMIYSAYTKNGNYIDIYRDGKALTYDKPKNILSEFESDRWRKYTENYLFNNNNYMRPYLCNYLIKKWNHEHPKNQITDLTIIFMKEISVENYQTKPLEKIALCNCQVN